MSEQQQKILVSSRRGTNVYHLNKDCQGTHEENLKWVPKSRFPDLRACERCTGEATYRSDEEYDTDHTCPYCGEEEIFALAKHLPKCDQT